MGTAYAVNQPQDTVVTNAAETVVATLGGVTSARPGQSVFLEGNINITGGTSTTAYVLRIREDGIAGNVVDELSTDTLATAVGSAEDHTIVATHAPAAELSNKTYVLTVVQTAGAAGGTCNHARLRAELSP